MNKQLFYISRLSRVLWLRASLFGLAAVGAALAAHRLGPLVPQRLADFAGKDATEELLKVMASSMLAVATFSLATVVAAYGSVTNNASPRAAALLLENKSAQNALSSFVAAFIFSIVGLVALGTGAFDGRARFVLFAETLAVLALVVLRLLRWIDQLSHLGRIGAAVDHIEKALKQALVKREPFLGGVPAGEPPRDAQAVGPGEVGYVQHVDVARLDRIAEDLDVTVHLAVLPGAFLRLSRPLLYVSGAGAPVDDQALEKLRRAVVVGDARTFQQDPRFGLVVLAEVASRALSPAVNDPGTAIDVVGTATRVLSTWAERHWELEARPRFRRVCVPGLSADDCFEDVFSPIARDGAAFVEVGVALQKAFADLAHSNTEAFRAAAAKYARRALERAELALEFEDDKTRIRELAAKVAKAAARDEPASPSRKARSGARAGTAGPRGTRAP